MDLSGLTAFEQPTGDQTPLAHTAGELHIQGTSVGTATAMWGFRIRAGIGLITQLCAEGEAVVRARGADAATGTYFCFEW